MIDPSAELDSTVQVSAGAVIGPHVQIGAETRIGPYAVIERNTRLGKRNRVWQFASVGADTQDQKYHGEPSTLEIGDDNQIREFTTIQRGTEGGGMVTRIGSRVLLMNYVHVAHDCQIGDDVILSNSTEIAGHTIMEEWVIAGGMCGVHQFVRIGGHAFLAAGAMAAQDVPPYSMVAGDRARLIGVNTVGLERRRFSAETIAALRRAMRTIFYSTMLRPEALAQVIERDGKIPEVRRLVDFIKASRRGVVSRSSEEA